ncbi:MAG: PIN domain-containing protein [Thermomicrobiales bacterium]
MTFLDTNIFLRFLTRDEAAKAEACRALFQRLDRGEEQATTSEAVIAEVVYVLSARSGVGYGLTPSEVAGRLKPLLSVAGLKLAHKGNFARALDLYAAQPFLDFEDALSLDHMERQGITRLMSYDRDFDRVPGITRQEPSAA